LVQVVGPIGLTLSFFVALEWNNDAQISVFIVYLQFTLIFSQKVNLHLLPLHARLKLAVHTIGCFQGILLFFPELQHLRLRLVSHLLGLLLRGCLDLGKRVVPVILLPTRLLQVLCHNT
jgi:hypothetical protein